MIKKYNKINEQQVLCILKKKCFDGMIILWSAEMIAKELGSSKYQVRKFLKILEKKGIIKHTHMRFPDIDFESQIDYGPSLPLWGYLFSGKTNDKY